ncbi:MAG: MFS transporter [Armatimonadia bacterium]
MASFQDRIAALKWTGRALRYRNYRLFFMGQGISLIGTWMQRMALQWFVYNLTHSPWLLGSLDFAGQIPALLLAPWAGLAADRFSRHRLVIITQCAAMLQAGLLAALVLTEQVHIWHLFALSIFLGCINGFDVPLRQSFVSEMVDDRADLGNAIALNSSVFNGARLIGPSVAGFILAVTSAGVCFLLNSLSYIAVIWALLVMKVQRREIPRQALAGLQGLFEGVRYVWHFASLRHLLVNLSLVTLFGGPFMTLMPVFAKKVLHGGPQTLGLLIATIGVGAIAGAFFLASRKSIYGLDRIIAVAMSSYAAGLILFSRSTSLPLSMGLLLFIGLGMMVQMAGTNTLLQMLVEDDKRGRVMSLYAMAFMGSGPLASLWGGFAATHIGAPLTVWIGGVLALATAGLFVTRLPVIRGAICRNQIQEAASVAPAD